MNLDAYLERIGCAGDLAPNFATLTDVHRAHLLAISYENLDIHLGGRLTLDIEQIFDKLVTRRRGGWCYEMNGLLAWALREIGFDVTMLASAVNRQVRGDVAEGNHLILRVDLDRPYLADVGFGNGLLEPIPLEAGIYTQRFLTYRLEHEGARWFFHNHQYGGAGFDFTLEPHQFSDFEARCHYLRTSPDFGFVQTTVCHRFTPDNAITMRGAVLRTVTTQGVSDQTIEDQSTYEQVLEEKFDLHLPDVSDLWQKVWARHQVWVKENT